MTTCDFTCPYSEEYLREHHISSRIMVAQVELGMQDGILADRADQK